MRFEWGASAGGEVLIVDGLHMYIGTTTARGRGETLSGSSAVVFDAIDEYNIQTFNPFLELPVGRYLCIIRAKDTDQVNNDFVLRARNQTDGTKLQEENDNRFVQLTSSFAYYQIVFDVTENDIQDDVRIPWVSKATATENTIFVDYFLIIPIGNGESFPQDLAHNAMRIAGKQRKIVDKRI